MKVLLTDGSHKNTLAILRYIGKYHKISILHHKKSAPSFSKYCSKLYLSPNINESEAYLQFILVLLEKEKFDLLIPVGIKAVELFSKNLQKLRMLVKIEIPEFHQIQPALFKEETFKLAKEIGIPHPETIYPNSIENAFVLAKNLNYPLIIKSSNEAKLKFATIYVENEFQFKQELSTLEEKYPFQFKNSFPIIQEKIVGSAYGFFCLYQHGVCKKIFMHKRLRELPVEGGSSTCAISIYDDDLKQLSIQLLDYLKWHGPAMVEYKKDEKDGLFKLIEINPKFWGSLELCLVSGMNLPLYICEMAKGVELEYSENYKKNIIFQWIISTNGELYRLFDKPSDGFKMIRDFFRFNSFSDINLYDFKPTWKVFTYLLVYIKNRLF